MQHKNMSDKQIEKFPNFIFRLKVNFTIILRAAFVSLNLRSYFFGKRHRVSVQLKYYTHLCFAQRLGEIDPHNRMSTVPGKLRFKASTFLKRCELLLNWD
jgi:hypothetical protein